jgi:hypothetical protein
MKRSLTLRVTLPLGMAIFFAIAISIGLGYLVDKVHP